MTPFDLNYITTKQRVSYFAVVPQFKYGDVELEDLLLKKLEDAMMQGDTRK